MLPHAQMQGMHIHLYKANRQDPGQLDPTASEQTNMPSCTAYGLPSASQAQLVCAGQPGAGNQTGLYIS